MECNVCFESYFVKLSQNDRRKTKEKTFKTKTAVDKGRKFNCLFGT